MKICLISGSYPETKCGVGDYTACLAEALSIESNDVHIITGLNQTIKRRGNVTIHPLLENWSLFNWYRLIRKIKILKPHVVHLQYPSRGYNKGLLPNVLFLILKLVEPSIKRIITLHEYDRFGWKGKLRLGLACNTAHAIVCTNEAEKDQIQKQYPKKGTCIHLGSSVGQLGKLDVNELTNKLLHQNILYFGTLMPNKGWETLIEALSILKEQKRSVILTAVCTLEPEYYNYHATIAQLIEKHKVSEIIQFKGYLKEDDLIDCFSKHDVAVLPFSEGVRLNRSSLIALLGYGKAVITTEPVVHVELIEHDKNCWMVPRQHPVALAEAIADLLDKKKLVRRLQEEAFKLSHHFSWSEIARSTMKRYHVGATGKHINP